MSYDPQWNNANALGLLEPGRHAVCLSDPAEIAAAVNRRRRLVYLAEQGFSAHLASGQRPRWATVAWQQPPPFRNFRQAVTLDLVQPTTGQLGGDPPTPAAMEWLWPEPDADQGKTIVACQPGPGEVGLLEKLGGAWLDDAPDGLVNIRAGHFNQLRQAMTWLVRGRWTLPIYFARGLFSLLPNTPWISDSLANTGSAELRSVGMMVARTGESPPRGLTNVAVGAASRIELTIDAPARIELYQCLRPVDLAGDPPTWNRYDPSAAAAWATPGGTGSGDAVLLGAADAQANTPAVLSGASVQAALQAMIDGAGQTFLARRADTGYETLALAGRAIIEFELISPPN